MNNKKATALALAVTMALTGGTVLTGCGENAKEQTSQEDKDKDNYIHHSSPFIYHNLSVNTAPLSGSTESNIKSSTSTSSGWRSWTSPKSGGGYSGVHAGSVAG